jgi:hypothetical protein
MTEKKANTATPHLRETPEQRQQVEHEDAIEDAGKDGKRVGAGFDPLKFGISSEDTNPVSGSVCCPFPLYLARVPGAHLREHRS